MILYLKIALAALTLAIIAIVVAIIANLIIGIRRGPPANR